MIIENSNEVPDIKRGRPGIYPFGDINPGQQMVIDAKEDIIAHYLSVRCSLNYYKKQRDLDWKTRVKIVDKTIIVYRIS